MERVGRWSFYLFVFSLPISLLGMEVFQSISFILSIPFFLSFRKRGDTLSILLSILFLLSLYLSNLLSFSLSDSSIHHGNLLNPLWSWLVFILTHLYIKGEREIEKGIAILLVSTILISIFGIFQHWTGWDPFREPNQVVEISGLDGRYYSIGLFSHHLTFAYSLIFPFSLSISLLFTSPEGKFWYRLAIPSAILSVFAIIFTFSRGAWFGIVCSCLFLFFVIAMRRMRSIYIPLLILFILISIILSIPSLRKRGESIFNLKSNSTRIQLWKGAIEMFRDNPLYGVGYRNFPEVSDRYSLRFDHDERPPHAHNTYLNILAESGIFSLLLFLSTISVPFIKGVILFKRTPNINSAFTTSILGGATALSGFLTGSFFQHSFDDVEVAKAFWFILGLMSIAIREQGKH